MSEINKEYDWGFTLWSAQKEWRRTKNDLNRPEYIKPQNTREVRPDDNLPFLKLALLRRYANLNQ